MSPAHEEKPKRLVAFDAWFLALEPVRGRAARLLAWLGRYSYAIYLVHVPYIFLLCSLLWYRYHWPINSLQGTLVMAAAALAVPILLRIASRRLLPARIDRLLFGG